MVLSDPNGCNWASGFCLILPGLGTGTVTALVHTLQRKVTALYLTNEQRSLSQELTNLQAHPKSFGIHTSSSPNPGMGKSKMFGMG